MLKRLTPLICLLVLTTLASAAPTEYRLQTEQSRVGFTWALGKEPVTGIMPVSRADVVLDFDNVANSRVRVAVDATRARPGAAFAGSAFRGKSVLWVERYPEITFESTSVRRDGQGGAIIDGRITVRGVTQPQRFTARLFRPAGAAPGDRRALTIRLNGSLSRAAFDADGYSDLVGDRVDLNIKAQVLRAE